MRAADELGPPSKRICNIRTSKVEDGLLVDALCSLFMLSPVRPDVLGSEGIRSLKIGIPFVAMLYIVIAQTCATVVSSLVTVFFSGSKLFMWFSKPLSTWVACEKYIFRFPSNTSGYAADDSLVASCQ